MNEISAVPSSLFAAPADPGPTQDLGKDTFLKLLTTQLTNQDPGSPMSNQDFIAQLAQFTSVESLGDIRSTMESAVMGIAALNNASMASLLGTTVTALGNEFEYDGEGPVTLHFDAATGGSGGTVAIYDETGKVVKTLDLGAFPAGQGTVTWDGTDKEGKPVGEGSYTFRITPDDPAVQIDELIVGTVTEMDYTGGTPRPSVDGVPVEIGDLLKLQAGTDDAAP